MENIFEKASRVKLRFNFNGQIGVEQLWDVKKDQISDLISYEQQLTEIVESYGKSTRRTRTTRTILQELDELRLEIVTYILDVKEKEAEEAKNAASAKEHNQKILELIAQKKNQQLAEMSIEDLQKMLK